MTLAGHLTVRRLLVSRRASHFPLSDSGVLHQPYSINTGERLARVALPIAVGAALVTLAGFVVDDPNIDEHSADDKIRPTADEASHNPRLDQGW